MQAPNTLYHKPSPKLHLNDGNISDEKGSYCYEIPSPLTGPYLSSKRPGGIISVAIERPPGSGFVSDRNSYENDINNISPFQLRIMDKNEFQDKTKGSNQINNRTSLCQLEINKERHYVKGKISLKNSRKNDLKQPLRFIDNEFPPELSSLTINPNEFPITSHIVWKRVTEIYKGQNMTLCSDKIGPNDIHQGYLGDCYFLSALSVLSERKEFIRRLFHTKEINPTGRYSIYLNDSGEWRTLTIDDYIPCIRSSKGYKPCFSRSKSNDIWVFLLEKAFAKLYGTYHNIDGGYQSEALSALTGAPTKYYRQKDNGIPPLEQVWLFITGNLQNDYIVTAASQSESQAINNDLMGIVSNHAYAILDAQEIKLSSGASERLIKIRNPWGSHVWKGEWGDKSPVWTPELRKALKYELGDGDGIFWMRLVDFDTHFNSICSCEIRMDYFSSSVRLGGKGKGKESVYIGKIKVNEDGFVNLTVEQKMKKHFRSDYKGYEYSFLRVMLVKVSMNDEVVSVVHGKYKSKQNIVIRRNLTQGNYLVFVEVDWVQEIHREIVITSYSKNKLIMKEENVLDYNIPQLYEKILKTYISQLSQSQDRRIKTKQFENFSMYKYKLERFGLVGILYKNMEKDLTLHIKLTLQNLINMEVNNQNARDESFIYLDIEPGEEKIIIFKARVFDKSDTTYIYQYSELSHFTQYFTNEQLKLLCQEKGVKHYSWRQRDLVVYSYKYMGGYADYYVNKKTKKTVQEKVVFNTENILINGQEINELGLLILPKQGYLVNMKVKDVFEKNRCERRTKYLKIK